MTRWLAVALTGVAVLVSAALALARTNLAAVRYAPPKITLVDQAELASQEDVVVTKDASQYSFAQPAGLVKHPDSKAGCTDNFSTDYRCPVAGIKKIVLKLGELNDGASIDLGSRASKVKQIMRGGAGEDTLTGGPGAQRQLGESGPDTINGGPGPDFIDGGGGTDTCDGGAGNDVIVGCE